MLVSLTIRNFVLIEDASLEFASGLNVFTGETGAGKTLLTRALGMLVGERAEDGLVGNSGDEAFVQAVFDVDAKTVAEMPQDITELLAFEPGELIVTRRLTKQGRNRCFVNDSTVTLATLAQVIGRLLSFAGQHEYRRLLDPAYQLAVLDEWSGPEAVQLAGQVATAVVEARETDRRLAEARRSQEARLRQIDFLNFQINELENAALSVEEEEELLIEQKRLASAEEILRLAGGAGDLLSGDNDQADAQGLVSQAAGYLGSLTGIDPQLDDVLSGLTEVQYQLAELSRELHGYLSNVAIDPARLQVVDDRLRQFMDMARKYGGDTAAALAYLDQASRDLDALRQVETDLSGMDEQREALIERALQLGGLLSVARHESAPRLEAAVVQQLADLGMGQACFEVKFDERSGWQQMRESGCETVEFMLAANPGHQARSLARTASGGELSRILLAMKCALRGAGGTETLVLDEVDAGIGGRTATAVGRKIKELAGGSQVLVVTHLAQVAAMAESHFMVEKGTGEDAFTRLTAVEDDERVTELCRMMGGLTSDTEAMAHARRLRDSAVAGLID